MYGLKCYDEDGYIIFDMDTAVTRIVYDETVSAGASSNTTLDIIGTEPIAIMTISLENDSGGIAPWLGATHRVTRSGTTITWTARGVASYLPGVDTRIVILMYT